MAKKKTAKKAKAVADFKKTKKKVGRIQKSEDTKLQITTRKINVPTQHNEKTGSLLYKGKSFTELIAGTKHTNSNVRVSNITNLRDHLHGSLDQVTTNLGQLVSRCGSLISDPEPSVRTANIALIQLTLQNCSDADLEPFVKVFIAQLSSSMLHIDKGVQTSTVQVITVLLATHPKIVHSSTCSLIPSLTVLLSTLKNKSTITAYLKVVALLLAYVLKQCTKDETRCQVRSIQTLIACRRLPTSSSPSMDLSAVAALVTVTVTHVERLWLEDVPPQVFLNADQTVLSNAVLLVELLILFTRLGILQEKAALVKLHEVSKSVAGRFPFECAAKGRTSQLLWRLNMTISKYLLHVNKSGQVEQYFTNLISNTSNKFSTVEVEGCLEVLKAIPNPGPALLDTLLTASTQQSANSVLFCTHFIQHYLDKIPQAKMDLILRSLDRSLDKVALHLIQYFHGNRKHVVQSVVVKSLDPSVFTTLQPAQQIQLLELCYSGVCVQSLAKAGQCITEKAVRDKFYSVLHAMLYSEHISTGQYVSVCLSQVHSQHSSPHLLSSTLLSALSVLPIKHQLFYLTLPKLVQQLYQGLSDQSLSCILRLVIGFVKWSAEKSTPSSAENNEVCSDETILKFNKIIFSLIFNNEGVNEWGKGIILLAVRLSILHYETLQYVVTQLAGQATEYQSWYFSLVLKQCKKKCIVEKCYGVVKEGLSQAERRDAEYQIKLMKPVTRPG